MSVLSLPFVSSSRAVLLVMDDGISVYHSSGSSIRFLEAFGWRESAFEEKLADVISRSGAASVVVLNDAVEQHYRKEKVPIITMFDRANIVKRRLNVAFPNYSMRAAQVLKQGTKVVKELISKDKEPSKGELYLFAAVPSTDAFGRIMMALRNIDVQIVGYGLLPVESVSLVDMVVKKLAQKKFGAGSARWSILISQHRGGGMRQVVIRDKELALTRVTPVIEPDPDAPGAWAADVSQELQATLSYLSRFGYTPEDGLEIVVIGDKIYTESLGGMIYAPCNFSTLSVEEAAKICGLKLPADHDSHFSENIHAGWVGKKLSLDLPLSSREIDEIKQPRLAALVIMVLCAFGVGAVSGYAVDEAMKSYRASVNLEVAKVQKNKIDRIYEEELLRKQRMGIDIALIKSSLDISSRIKNVSVDPLTVLAPIARELDSIRLDKIEFVNSGSEVAQTATPGQEIASRATSVTLFVSFAGSIKPKDGNQEIDDLVGRLNERLAEHGYKAAVTKKLKDLTYKGVVDSEVGLIASKRSSEDRYEAEIQVTKVGQNG